MAIAEDITGQRFGRLVAIEHVGSSPEGVTWLFACDCGAQKIAGVGRVRSGRTKSCGCLRTEKRKTFSLTHGHSKGGKVSSTYRSWAQAKLRLKITKTDTGRLRPIIPMCASWKSDFEEFLKDMGECPDGHKLARIDRTKGFTPENCEWVPR